MCVKSFCKKWPEIPLIASFIILVAKINDINKIDFEKLLKQLYKKAFQFRRKTYKQIDGVAMGSPLGPTLANAFLCCHEKIWLNECPDEFKPAYYRRSVDNILALFCPPDHLEKFKMYVNSKHRNIRFTCEKEQNNSMPFSDVLITSEPSMVLKHLCITNTYLVESIQVQQFHFQRI